MQVQKLRAPNDGLVPAGHYFKRLSRALRDSNAREAATRKCLDAEERSLEDSYRRMSASRWNSPH